MIYYCQQLRNAEQFLNNCRHFPYDLFSSFLVIGIYYSNVHVSDPYGTIVMYMLVIHMVVAFKVDSIVRDRMTQT